MKFEKIEIKKDGRLVLTVKSGFAFEIQASSVPNGIHISPNNYADNGNSVHLAGDKEDLIVVSVFGRAKEN